MLDLFVIDVVRSWLFARATSASCIPTALLVFQLLVRDLTTPSCVVDIVLSSLSIVAVPSPTLYIERYLVRKY